MLPGQSRNDYDLKLFTSVLMGKDFVKSLTQTAQNWRRTIRLQGGYWMGTFRIVAPMYELVSYFYTWLGYHVEESVRGVKSWEGMVYEMVLNTPNASRVKSFDQMYNIGLVKYIDGAGAQQLSSVVSEPASSARYGWRVFHEDVGTLGATAAAAMAASYLAEHAWPWARPQASGGGEVSLDVTVCGYVFPANWRKCYVSSDRTSTIHDEIADILADFCDDYLTAGTLAANTTSVERVEDQYDYSWEFMQKLVKAGDASGNLYRLYVGNDRLVYYEQVSTSPDYYIVNGVLRERLAAAEAMNPWLVKPGVFRDMDYPVSIDEPGSYLSDARDSIVEEVSCGANSGLTWQALDFSESAQLAAFQEIDKGAAPAPAGGGGETVQRTITDEMLRRMGTSRARWAKMTPAQRRKMKKKL